MGWIEVKGDIHRKKAKRCQEVLENLGAVAVSLMDPGVDPLFEPLPGTTPLWENLKIVGLFDDSVSKTALALQLQQQFPHMTFEIEPLPEQDWTRTWLEHFHPQAFGDRLWVMPSDYPDPPEMGPDPVILTLDPGLAWGTGTHATTALCLRWLANNQKSIALLDVLDFGCGSGILGIAACLLGVHKVWAIDHDPQAITATRDNANRNAIPESQLCVQLNNHPEAVPTVDVILANILAMPLIELAPQLQGFCRLHGKIVLSGILENQAEQVMDAYRPWFTFEPVQVQEGWVLLIGTKFSEISFAS